MNKEESIRYFGDWIIQGYNDRSWLDEYSDDKIEQITYNKSTHCLRFRLYGKHNIVSIQKFYGPRHNNLWTTIPYGSMKELHPLLSQRLSEIKSRAVIKS